MAGRIFTILNTGESVTDRHSGVLRAVRPSDIAVLCFSHKQAAIYADALQRLGLPVRISREGWLSSRAVAVARHALALAADPSDSHAALCLLTLGPRALPLEEALRDLADARLLDRDELRPLLQLAPEAASVPVGLLLARVLDAAGLRDWAEALPDPDQAIADLLRLEHEAQEFEAAHRDMKAAAGFHGYSPKVFLGWLDARLNERDFDRHPDPSSGSALGIEIVTWHAAKGREWPIVAVAELDRKIGERPGTTSAEFADFSNLDNVLATARLIHTPGFAAKEKTGIFVEDRRPSAEANARTLLYVVLTRARDRLILEWPDFAFKKASDAPGHVNHAALLRDECGLSFAAGQVTLGGRDFAARILLAGKESPPEFDAEIESFPTGAVSFGERREMPASVHKTPWRRRPSQLASAPALPGPLRSCDLGTPVATGEDGFDTATERGTVWHLAFRTLASRPDLAARLVQATALDEATLAAIAAQASAVRNWLAAEGYPKLHFELPIQIVEANGAEVNAVIDCLAEGDDGFFIIDHKSGAAPDPEARFTGYWPQLSAYAEAVRRVFPGKPVRHVAVNWMNEGKLSILDLAHVEAGTEA